MAKNGHRRSKIRRRAYKPKAIMALGGLQIIKNLHAAKEDAAPIIEDDQKDLHIAYRTSYDAMLRGAGTEETWSTVVVSLNVALILTEQGIGAEYEPDLVGALDGAFRAKIRAGRIGRWGFDGPAITAINLAFQIHEAQIELVSKAEVRAALQEVYRRINEGHIYREAA